MGKIIVILACCFFISYSCANECPHCGMALNGLDAADCPSTSCTVSRVMPAQGGVSTVGSLQDLGFQDCFRKNLCNWFERLNVMAVLDGKCSESSLSGQAACSSDRAANPKDRLIIECLRNNFEMALIGTLSLEALVLLHAKKVSLLTQYGFEAYCAVKSINQEKLANTYELIAAMELAMLRACRVVAGTAVNFHSASSGYQRPRVLALFGHLHNSYAATTTRNSMTDVLQAIYNDRENIQIMCDGQRLSLNINELIITKKEISIQDNFEIMLNGGYSIVLFALSIPIHQIYLLSPPSHSGGRVRIQSASGLEFELESSQVSSLLETFRGTLTGEHRFYFFILPPAAK